MAEIKVLCENGKHWWCAVMANGELRYFTNPADVPEGTYCMCGELVA